MWPIARHATRPPDAHDRANLVLHGALGLPAVNGNAGDGQGEAGRCKVRGIGGWTDCGRERSHATSLSSAMCLPQDRSRMSQSGSAVLLESGRQMPGDPAPPSCGLRPMERDKEYVWATRTNLKKDKKKITNDYTILSPNPPPTHAPLLVRVCSRPCSRSGSCLGC